MMQVDTSGLLHKITEFLCFLISVFPFFQDFWNYRNMGIPESPCLQKSENMNSEIMFGCRQTYIHVCSHTCMSVCICVCIFICRQTSSQWTTNCLVWDFFNLKVWTQQMFAYVWYDMMFCAAMAGNPLFWCQKLNLHGLVKCVKLTHIKSTMTLFQFSFQLECHHQVVLSNYLVINDC